MNAVQVTVNLTAARGNPVSLFFANVLRVCSSANVTATAIAGVKRHGRGHGPGHHPDPTLPRTCPTRSTGQQTILSDFNTYSPGSDVGVVQFTGWGSTWVAMQQVGSKL